ncbi:hypothetical protein GCM10010995_09680 [Cysteiniphilum litorale]|uniref:Uncharacterized protein n=1 Tax=Cysteiniphilum litorale TaxID=2056700 RepID=A0A8J2Z3M4_9GAMM|nr:hypothetical protein GCM10010995_09680 [Cysteiniphilum litorale]
MRHGINPEYILENRSIKKTLKLYDSSLLKSAYAIKKPESMKNITTGVC